MQKELDQSILDSKPEMTKEERFTKTLVALSVELAEVANCEEHFKFWKDNKGKVDYNRFFTLIEDSDFQSFKSNGVVMYEDSENSLEAVTEEQAHKLTLVEECADALHFVLSLANQLDINLSSFEMMEINNTNKSDRYLFINRDIVNLFENHKYQSDLSKEMRITFLCSGILNYFKSLGLTAEELEKAYYDKHKVNYKRQEEGY